MVPFYQNSLVMSRKKDRTGLAWRKTCQSILLAHIVYCTHKPMLDPQKIFMSRVKQAYGLNEHEAQSLLHELSPDGVFPYVWQKAYSIYWKYPAAEIARLYKVENPSFPETHSQPIKHCPADVYAKWIADFFFELARRIYAKELENGFDYIVESTYDDKSAASESEREYLFYPLMLAEKNIANIARVEGLKEIDAKLFCADVIFKIFPDTIAVDKIAAIHYLSVVLKYSRQGVTQSGHFPGLFEITNCSNGYHDHVEPPKLIGDPDKARAVLEAGKSTLALTEGPDAMRGEIRALSDLMNIESPEQ
jgi:hypothetical protein